MKEIFAKRRKLYYAQNLKYLRYVFNDHFMLFLVIALGALAVQYVQFLQQNQLNVGFRALIAVLVSLLALLPGKLVTLLEAADSTFLLPKEEELNKYLKNCQSRSLILPAVLILVMVLLAAPAVKISGLIAFLWFLVLVFIKGLLLMKKRSGFQTDGRLDFEAAIDYERKRRTNLLKIFALFTDVKGLTSHAKRRKYLDFLLPKREKSAYSFLFLRSFLRAGDYFGLTLRLLILSLILIVFVSNIWAVLLMLAVIDYLLIFQLVSIEKSHEYQTMLKIYPLNEAQKGRALKQLLQKVIVLVTLCQLLFLIPTFWLDWKVLIILPIAYLIGFLYPNYRISQKK